MKYKLSTGDLSDDWSLPRWSAIFFIKNQSDLSRKNSESVQKNSHTCRPLFFAVALQFTTQRYEKDNGDVILCVQQNGCGLWAQEQ